MTPESLVGTWLLESYVRILDDGVIAAQGTHEELLHESALYNEILGSQLLESVISG